MTGALALGVAPISANCGARATNAEFSWPRPANQGAVIVISIRRTPRIASVSDRQRPWGN